MRKISADYIFPISSPPIKDGVVVMDDDGEIIEILNPIPRNRDNIQSREIGTTFNIEFYQGIICPGFINAHCHLELSHLKGKFPEKTGLAEFIKNFQNIRKTATDNVQQAIEKAEMEMIANGIVGVGDISNTSDSFAQKEKKKLKYHTFLEAFSFNPDKAEEVFLKVISQLSLVNCQTFSIQHSTFNISLTPHSPYSVSEKLFRKISEYNSANGGLMSIHNQETRDENNLFLNKTGKIAEMLEHFGNDLSEWKNSKKNSLQTIFPYLLPLNKNSRILFVHNTFTTKEDIDFIKSKIQNPKSKIFFCFCPNANLFIENSLPDFQMFIDENAKITVGTDSLASNWGLNILAELKTISKHCPQISLNNLLTWATKNGAEFFGWDELGTLEIGKKPHLNLIQNLDLKNLKLTSESSVVPLI